MDSDSLAVRTSCGRRDMMIALTGKGDGIWAVNVCLTILILTLVVVLGAALYTAINPTDSQGTPAQSPQRRTPMEHRSVDNEPRNSSRR